MIYSATRDFTMTQRPAGPGMDCRPRWLCGHKHSNGQKRRVAGLQPLLWRCIDCAGKKGQE